VPPYDHPIPGRPEPCFLTKHEAAELTRQYIAQGHIKKCAHLYVGESEPELFQERVFFPGCAQHSFKFEPGPVFGPDDLDRWYFYGCPENCRYYRAAWKGRLITRLGKVARFAAAPFKWFERQDAKVKLGLILLGCLLIAPKVFDNLVEVIKVLK
jgi:hypothetical protein